MAKRAQYYEEAKTLYVQKQCTLAEIAGKLGLGEKTVQLWKKQGDWDEKRKAYLAEETSFHEDLYRLARILLKSIKDDLENGVKVDPGRMYAFTKLIPSFTKVKEYEDSVASQASASSGNQTRELTPEVVKLIEKEVLGIERQ